MIERLKIGHWLSCVATTLILVLGSACSSSDSESDDTNEQSAETVNDISDETSTDTSNTTDESTNVTDEPADITDETSTAFTTTVFTCEEIATKFVTRGSANADLADPEVSASCTDDTVTVRSNQIPDFPYIETSPGNPQVYDLEYSIPATPVVADEVSDIPALGAIGVAINGIPIYGATEGTGGDVLSLGSGFTECGGHNGPTGYHYHTFDATGSDYCLFTEAEANAEPQLFGYAFDGYPIYSGNTQYTSSWYLDDESLFATDTFSAHVYFEGSGDLDQCNGRTDEDGNYAYYTTEIFPYTLGCYRGEVEVAEGGRNGPGNGPGGVPPNQ